MPSPDNENAIAQRRAPDHTGRRDIDFFARTLRLAASSEFVEAKIISQIEKSYPSERIETENSIIRKGAAKKWKIVVLRDGIDAEPDTIGLVFSDGKGVRCVGAFVPSTDVLIVEIKGNAFDENCRPVDTNLPELSHVKSTLDTIRNSAENNLAKVSSRRRSNS